MPVLEPVLMSGAVLVAGPFLVGPGFPQPLEQPHSKQRDRFYLGSNRGAYFREWMYSHRVSIWIQRISHSDIEMRASQVLKIDVITCI